MKKRKRQSARETGDARRKLQKAIGIKPVDEHNYDEACDVCGGSPTVGATLLCGPCCFGTADALEGNW